MTESALPISAAANAIRKDRGVGIWLLAIAVLIGVMVVVGGLTRLTGSGLSITEWRPVTGALPPMSEADWASEFAKYQGTPQYELLNKGMGLAGFKSIYWWEWSHRFIGRVIGFVFAIPFALFLYQRRITRSLAYRLAGIFALGGAQAVIGWWMVQSGFQPSRVAVSQYWLATHLCLAIILFGLTLWAALEVLGAKHTGRAALARYRGWAAGLTVLVLVQMLLGAFMSGTKAGLAFDTWPDYAGRWLPLGMYDLSPWWINHFENPNLIHFQHRTVAYVVVALIAWLYYALTSRGMDKPVKIALVHVVAIVLIQMFLGILTVELHVPLAVAALHQICALFLFGAALWLAYALTPDKTAP